MTPYAAEVLTIMTSMDTMNTQTNIVIGREASTLTTTSPVQSNLPTSLNIIRTKSKIIYYKTTS